MRQRKTIVTLVFLGLSLVWLAACQQATGTGSVSQQPAMPTAATTQPGGMDMGGQHQMGPMPGEEMSGQHQMGPMDQTSQPGHEGPLKAQGVPLATETEGGKPLAFREENGVKVFELTAKAVRWPILKDVIASAWTYNGTIPGPLIRVTEGDRVRVVLKNELPVDTSIHWHGIPVPNAMDGVPPFTQAPVKPGQTFTYEFEAKPAGSFMYHSHVDTDTQIPLGLYAPLIIDPKNEKNKPDVDVMLMLSEWRIDPKSGDTWPAMPMVGMEPNFFTINGKAFPETQTLEVKRGQRVRLRLAAIGQFTHPMHLHGQFFKVVATDGNPVPEAAQLTKDTIAVNPGERYDVEFVAENQGTWVLHCHVLHHVTNDNVEPGGLIMVVKIT